MADILPIKAWRYSEEFNSRMEELISPLFDVVSPSQRKALYETPLNSIHLAVPDGKNPIQEAQVTLADWKNNGIIKQDEVPGIYVYYQYFRLPGAQEESCRKGFMAQIKAYSWDERVILRHENTIKSAVNDRIDLLKATQLQASPTHGLYEDHEEQLEQYMDEAMKEPLYELDDYQGVREVLARITDPKVIQKFVSVMKDKQVILADGHHRLEGAISYRKEMEGAYPEDQWKGYDYHLMYLTNTSGNHVKILPTHRLFYGMEISESELLEKLGEWFIIKTISDPEELETYAFHKPHTFGLLLIGGSYILKLKEGKFDEINTHLPACIRKLDLSVLHELLFAQTLGIPMEEQRSCDQISYERNFARCIQEVRSGSASLAVITRELQMSQIIEVCKSGELMPQKSTYFYPKALGGLLFASINQEEFKSDYGLFVE